MKVICDLRSEFPISNFFFRLLYSNCLIGNSLRRSHITFKHSCASEVLCVARVRAKNRGVCLQGFTSLPLPLLPPFPFVLFPQFSRNQNLRWHATHSTLLARERLLRRLEFYYCVMLKESLHDSFIQGWRLICQISACKF